MTRPRIADLFVCGGLAAQLLYGPWRGRHTTGDPMKISDLSPHQRGYIKNKATAALSKLPSAGLASDTYAERVLWESVIEACAEKVPEPVAEPEPAPRRRSRRRSRSSEGDR